MIGYIILNIFKEDFLMKIKKVVKEGLTNFKENVIELKDEAVEFVTENSSTIFFVTSMGFFIWVIGLNNGIDFVNKRMIEGYKNDGYSYRGDGLKFKKRMKFSDWIDYLDHMYNTKGGKKNKNINKYLKEKGFID